MARTRKPRPKLSEVVGRLAFAVVVHTDDVGEWAARCLDDSVHEDGREAARRIRAEQKKYIERHPEKAPVLGKAITTYDGAQRSSRLRRAADKALGGDWVRWIVMPDPELGSRSPSDLARESDEGLSAALTRLEQVRAARTATSTQAD